MSLHRDNVHIRNSEETKNHYLLTYYALNNKRQNKLSRLGLGKLVVREYVR